MPDYNGVEEPINATTVSSEIKETSSLRKRDRWSDSY